jgi:type VI secretion system FHA domain protein
MAESALVHVPPVLTAPQQPLGAVIHSAADGEVLQALLRGLGLPDLTFKGSATELAENVGAMLREATAGTMDVLMARALTKKESRVDMTMIAVRSNNPLKFFPNADSALTQLLTNAMAGYMPAVQAVGSAFDDIKAHELSVIAGMRAALMALLERFDPVQFEQRLAPATVMEKMAGGASRKAKMWDQMVEVHTQVAREVDGTQGLFGGTFSSAYQAQIDRLSRGDN